MPRLLLTESELSDVRDSEPSLPAEEQRELEGAGMGEGSANRLFAY